MASSLFLQLNGGYSTPGPVGIGTTDPKASTLTLGSAISAVAELSTPGTITATAVAGGSLAQDTTYYFKVTAYGDDGGETLPSAQASATTTAANKTINLSWAPVVGSVSYWLYYGTTAALGKRVRVGSNPVYAFATADPGAAQALPTTAAAYRKIVGDGQGSQNVFLGAGAGYNNTYASSGATATAGYHNVYIGLDAGLNDQAGRFNVIVGTDAALTTANAGNANVVIGASAASAITGNYNAVGGQGAATAMTASDYNSAWGALAFPALTTGATYNTAAGYGAGAGLTTGGTNTFLGSRTGVAVGAEAATGSTAVGDSAQITRTNGQMVLGAPGQLQIKAHGDTHVLNVGTLGSESLANPTLTSGTSWGVTGDFALASDAATYTHSTGTGTLSQASGTLAVAGRAQRWYKFTYVVSAVTGSPSASLTAFGNGAPQDQWKLDLTAGTRTLYIYCNPGNFTITGTSSAAATFTLDTFSLKEVQGGDLYVGGTFYYGSFNTQTTVGAAGGASALPATPTGYIKIKIDGTQYVIPYYAAS